MIKQYVALDVPYPIKCCSCIHVLYDQLLRYDICKIDKRPYYQDNTYIMLCDDYKIKEVIYYEKKT